MNDDFVNYELFSRQELLHATSISVRNLQHIREKKWLMLDEVRVGNRSKYTDDDVSKLAITYVLSEIGLPLKISCFIVDEYFHEIAKVPASAARTWEIRNGLDWRNATSHFQAHKQVSAFLGGEYIQRKAIKHDWVIAVADGIVSSGFLGGPRLGRVVQEHFGVDPFGVQPLGRISYSKGSEPQFSHVSAEIDIDNVSELIIANVDKDYQKSTWDAVGMIQVNCSLAIRNAFDRIIASRGVS